MATPTDRYAKVRTATPGAVADYVSDTDDVATLTTDLAAFGAQLLALVPVGEWERREWERLADLAMGAH